MRIQSERLPRWLRPPPARTAALDNERRPGTVLRVSQTRALPPAAAAAAYCEVSVAMPDRNDRKFNAVRSPVRIELNGPRTMPNTSPAASSAPSSTDHDTSTLRSSWAKVSVAQRVPARRPG